MLNYINLLNEKEAHPINSKEIVLECIKNNSKETVYTLFKTTSFLFKKMPNLIKNIEKIQSYIPNDVTIVLATKHATTEDIRIISDHFPNIIFGENRVQIWERKTNAFPNIMNPWHFIGHLQRNKVKKVIGNYKLIHSVDSIRLLKEIDTVSENNQTDLLFQVNPEEEESKFGFNELSILETINVNKGIKPCKPQRLNGNGTSYRR